MDIRVYNSQTPTKREESQFKPQFRKMAEDMKRVYDDPKSSIDQIAYYSTG